jgi:diadenosine tetraphosphatase ApaH/serine/threonine PP2A family protein phosphatase
MRILLVSDIHSNLAALDAVIKDAGHFDRIWCLGDVVGYGPQPNECIERLRTFDLVCLAGNHDLAVVDKQSLDDFSPDAREAAFWTRDRLAAVHCRWLETLPGMAVMAKYDITLVHASPREPVWEYMIDTQIAGACFDAVETPVGLNGHTHIPIIFRKPTYGLGVVRERLAVNVPVSLTLDRMFVNPGSVGQPRDDDPRAAYAMVDLEAMTLTHYRVQYDVAATQRAMRHARLPERLIRRLRFGE